MYQRPLVQLVPRAWAPFSPILVIPNPQVPGSSPGAPATFFRVYLRYVRCANGANDQRIRHPQVPVAGMALPLDFASTPRGAAARAGAGLAWPHAGVVTKAAAQRALTVIQEEQDKRSIGRVQKLYTRSREAAVRYLVGDTAAEELGPLEPEWGG